MKRQLLPVDDLVAELGGKLGGWYPFCEQSFRVKGTWRTVPWFWVSFPGTVNQALFAKHDLAWPDTWADVLAAGTKLKKAGPSRSASPSAIAATRIRPSGPSTGASAAR